MLDLLMLPAACYNVSTTAQRCVLHGTHYSLLLLHLLGGLGDFSGTWVLLGDVLDDTDSHGLSHVTDSETTEGWVLREGLNAHGLLGHHLDDGGVSRLDVGGVVLKLLTRTTIDLLDELGELAGNVGSMAINNWCVSSVDLARVVQDDDLRCEFLGLLGRVLFAVTSYVSTTDVLYGHRLDVEANVVTGQSLSEGGVVHLYRFNLSSDGAGSEGDDHTGLKDTCLNTTDGDRSNTSNLVYILEWETEGLVCGALGGLDAVKALEQRESSALLASLLCLPSLEPAHLLGLLQHVVSVPSRDGAEWNIVGVVSDLLDVACYFLYDLKVTSLAVGWLSVVHLVDTDDQLLDTKGVGEQGVLTGLSVLGDTGLEFSDTSSDDKYGTISLGSTSDHVLDEITMSGGINDGDIVLGGFELPQGNVDGNSTLTLGLQFVKDPSILK